jgi:DNA-binding NtrC family response regulator
VGWEDKKLSAGARKVLESHRWPGNVRELLSTIRRAAIWASGTTIDKREAQEALLSGPNSGRDSVLGLALGDGFNVREILAFVEKHYLSRAMSEASGNKTKAAELLGLGNYQTLTNWLQRHGMEP